MIDAVSVTNFLRSYFDLRISNVEQLGAGMFSQAFSFNLEQEEFVIRLNPLFDRTCMEQEVYKIYFSTIQEHLPFCYTNKYWVHGDFGFENVISCGKKITGVLDWAESRLGDFVYDLAYLEFWSNNVPYKQLWQNWAESQKLYIDNFEQRMHCYMIHIGLASLAIAAIQDNFEDYTQVKARMQTVFAQL